MPRDACLREAVLSGVQERLTRGDLSVEAREIAAEQIEARRERQWRQ
jgi:hypothetical protein